MPFGKRAKIKKKSSKQEKFYNSPYRYFFNQSSVHTHCSGLDSRVLRSLKKKKEKKQQQKKHAALTIQCPMLRQ